MTVVIRHAGKKGVTGTTGIDGAGVDDVRGSLIESPVFDLFKPNKISSAVTWTRDDDASFVDRYGRGTFVTGDSFIQIVRRTDNYNSSGGYWEYPDLDTAIISDRTVSDPFGGTGATRLEFTGTDNSTFGMNGSFTGVVDTEQVYRFSFYARLESGTIDSIQLRFGAANATLQTFSTVITSDWKRFDIVTQPSATGTTFRLFFRTSGTAQVDLFRVNSTTGVLLRDPVFYDGLTDQIVNNPNPVYRENNKGYLIEGEKENLCPYSQALTEWDVIGGATIEQLPEAGPYGNIDLPILVQFGSNQSISVSRSDLAIIEGSECAVSFFAKVYSGEVESLSVSLGGEVSQPIDVTDEFVEYRYLLTAGSQPSIAFNAVSSSSGTSFVITSVQVETDSHSSYIPTAEQVSLREADLVSVVGSVFIDFSKPFTLMLSVSDLPFVDGGSNTIFKKGNTVLLTNGDGIVFQWASGVVTFLASESTAEYVLTYDGASLVFYVNGEESSSISASITDASAPTAYIGATDATGSNALNASIKSLKAWDFAMTDSEVKYVSGTYQLNRFIDRG